MPQKYKVTLDDGRSYAVTTDGGPPDEAEILRQLGTGGPAAPATPQVAPSGPPGAADPAQLGPALEHARAFFAQPPPPSPLQQNIDLNKAIDKAAPSASLPGFLWEKVNTGMAPKATYQVPEPQAGDDPLRQAALAEMGGGKAFYNAAVQPQTSPLGAAFAVASGGLGQPMAGLLPQALRVGAQVGWGAEGLRQMDAAARAHDAPTGQRLLQGGLGAAQALMAGLGLRGEMPAAPPRPQLRAPLAEPQQLPLPFEWRKFPEPPPPPGAPPPAPPAAPVLEQPTLPWAPERRQEPVLFPAEFPQPAQARLPELGQISGLEMLGKMSGTMGGAAAGAAADDEHPVRGAILGGVAGFAGAHLLAKTPAAYNAGRLIASHWRDSFSKMGTGPQGKQAWSALVAENAIGERNILNFSRSMEELRGAVDRLDDAGQRAFTDIYENPALGVGALPPALQPVAREIQKTYRDLYDQIKALGGLRGVEEFDEHWLGRRWKNAGQVAPPEQAIDEWMGTTSGTNAARRSGGAAFQKPRTFDTAAEGRAAALTEAHVNPVDQAIDKVREMNRWITEKSAMRVFDAEGLRRRIAPGTREPSGWVPDSSDPYRQTFIHPGAYKALETWRSQGITGNPIVDAAKAVAQRVVMYKLAISGFHAVTTTVHGVEAGVAMGVKDLVNKGDVLGAVTKILSAPIAPLKFWRAGNKFNKEQYFNPAVTPAASPELDAYLKSGQKSGMDDFYKTGSVRKFQRGMAREGGGIAGGLRHAVSDPLNALAAGVEAPTRLLMDKLVQPMKTGIQLARNEQNLAQTRAPLNPRLERAVLQEGGRATDDIMGMMNYRNIQMPKAVKDIAMMGTTAPGWNYGTGRLFAGGAKDLLSIPSRVKQGLPALSDRAASAAIGLPLTVAGLNALYQRFRGSGEWPQDFADVRAPRTGEINKEGDPERIILQNYLSRDVASMAHDPLGTLAHKVNPLPTELADLLTNKDWRGTEIRDKEAPFGAQAKQVGGYLLKQNLPISAWVAKKYLPAYLAKHIENPTRERVGTDLGTRLEEAMGIQPAPSWMTRDPAIQKAMELQAGHFPASRTLQEQERIDTRREGRAAVRTGDTEALGQMLEQGTLRPQDILTFAKTAPAASRLQALTRGMTADDLIQLWGAASPTQRQILIPRMVAALQSQTISPKDRERLQALLTSK